MAIEIFLGGAVTDFDDPFLWQRELQEEYPEYDYLNPYELNDFDMGDEAVYDDPSQVVEPALEEARDVDAMLVHWDEDVELPGTILEMYAAMESDVPVVIWYEGYRDTNRLQPALMYLTRGRYKDTDKAMTVLTALAGDRSNIR